MLIPTLAGHDFSASSRGNWEPRFFGRKSGKVWDLHVMYLLSGKNILKMPNKNMREQRKEYLHIFTNCMNYVEAVEVYIILRMVDTPNIIS